jgi:hypothetical protein
LPDAVAEQLPVHEQGGVIPAPVPGAEHHAVSSLLSGLTVPWWITGGCAIDLAAGHVSRDHADVNVMMLERDEYALRGLTGVGIPLGRHCALQACRENHI